MDGIGSTQAAAGLGAWRRGLPWWPWPAAATGGRPPEAAAPPRWVVPPSRPRLSRFKPLATARTMVVRLSGEQLLLSVEHEALAGITPPMLSAWYRGLPRTLWHAGREYARHALWHPVDHVHWSLLRPAPRGGMGVGARVHEVVACGGRPDRIVEMVADVERLDDGGFTLVRRWLGVQVMRLEHRFRAGDGGADVQTRLWVGVGGEGRQDRAARWVNRSLQPRLLDQGLAQAWMRHCVEQIGLLQGLLPRLSKR